MEKLPAKLAAYRDWRERLGAPASRVDLALPWGDEDGSVRKTLRRLVSHELTHTKSIARVVRAHAERFR